MGRPHLIARIIVFSVNFTLWASGILLIVFGSIGVADPTATVKLLNLIDGVSNVTDIIDVTKYVEGVAIFMIVLGCFLFLLGGNGCHGIMRKNRRSIMSYMGLMLCAILIEIALIIYSSVYPGTVTDNVQSDMGKSLNQTYANITTKSPYFDNGLKFTPDNPIAESWQRLEFETACCGAVKSADYAIFTIFINNAGSTSKPSAVPLSCCKLNSTKALPKSTADFIDYLGCTNGAAVAINAHPCSNTVDDMIWQFNIIAIIISSCLIGAELLGVIFSTQLCRQADDA